MELSWAWSLTRRIDKISRKIEAPNANGYSLPRALSSVNIRTVRYQLACHKPYRCASFILAIHLWFPKDMHHYIHVSHLSSPANSNDYRISTIISCSRHGCPVLYEIFHFFQEEASHAVRGKISTTDIIEFLGIKFLG